GGDPASQCRIGRMADHEDRREGADRVTPPSSAARGFATRAIRAAHRLPVVEQTPTSVPIYQSVTFSAADAEELGAVATRQIPGYAYGRLDNPTVVAFASAVAELEGAEAGFAFASGMAAIHATRGSYGTTRALLDGAFRRLGVASEFVDVTDHAAVETALAARPTRILYAE